ncbi:hypothetical protein HJFPF1_12147 [Paramyrothecium foliicola]|nr:hypothetical protein HJFPF1_12147 [Paramyrothecium foliicola]
MIRRLTISTREFKRLKANWWWHDEKASSAVRGLCAIDDPLDAQNQGLTLSGTPHDYNGTLILFYCYGLLEVHCDSWLTTADLTMLSKKHSKSRGLSLKMLEPISGEASVTPSLDKETLRRIVDNFQSLRNFYVDSPMARFMQLYEEDDDYISAVTDLKSILGPRKTLGKFGFEAYYIVPLRTGYDVFRAMVLDPNYEQQWFWECLEITCEEMIRLKEIKTVTTDYTYRGCFVIRDGPDIGDEGPDPDEITGNVELEEERTEFEGLVTYGALSMTTPDNIEL